MYQSISNFKNAIDSNAHTESVIVSAIAQHIVKEKNNRSEKLEDLVFNELNERFRPLPNENKLEDLFQNRTCFMISIWGSALYNGNKEHLSPKAIAVKFIKILSNEIHELALTHTELQKEIA